MTTNPEDSAFSRAETPFLTADKFAEWEAHNASEAEKATLALRMAEVLAALQSTASHQVREAVASEYTSWGQLKAS